MDHHRLQHCATTPRPDYAYAGTTARDQDYEARMKQRRNRTTQSCLNCHTSKRKCDRKRPCSRCIQLGMTALCVYEVEDPATRDDPNVDELTRSRKRIAELEAILRELRGKPHPRVQSLLCDYDGGPFDESRSRSISRSSSLSAGPMPVNYDASVDVNTDGTLPAFFHGAYTFDELNDYLPISPGVSSSGEGSPFTDSSSSSVHGGDFPSRLCSCAKNVMTQPTLSSLAHALHTAFTTLQRLPEHARDDRCLVLQTIKELQTIISSWNTEPSTSPFITSSAPHAHLAPPQPVISPSLSTRPQAFGSVAQSLPPTYQHVDTGYSSAPNWHYSSYTSINENGALTRGTAYYGQQG